MSAFAANGRFGETPPKSMGIFPAGVGARLFVAIDVGDAVRAEATRVIHAISSRLETVKTPPKIVWVRPEALHVTLRFIGEVTADAVPALCDRLAPPIAMTPFDVEWRGLGVFPSIRQPRALWLGVVAGGAALGALEAEVTRRLVGTVEPEAQDVRGTRSPVDHVTLYRSRLSHKGPHYTGLVSAPLVANRE